MRSSLVLHYRQLTENPRRSWKGVSCLKRKIKPILTNRRWVIAMVILDITNTKPTPCSHYQSSSPQNLSGACVSCPVVHSVFRTARLREPIRFTHRPLNPLLLSFRERCACASRFLFSNIWLNLPLGRIVSI